MIYDTEAMHTTATTIQQDATQLQSDVNSFWTNFGFFLTGTPVAFGSCLLSFIDPSKPALEKMLQDRTALGKTLGQAATTAERVEKYTARSFNRF